MTAGCIISASCLGRGAEYRRRAADPGPMSHSSWVPGLQRTIACWPAPGTRTLTADGEPFGRRANQRILHALVLERLDCLADEGLDEERLGFGLRNAARLQIEQQVLVQRPGRRAVAALHIVGENLELRLVVGFGVLREQQRLRHHLAVGLLRARTDDDLALEYAAALAVEHRLIELAAEPARNRVVDDQLVVDMLAALDQIPAVESHGGALAGKAHAQLVANQSAARREDPVAQTRLRAHRR